MTTLALPMSESRIGPLLREWRTRRRMSQLELALETGISTRHLSFLETGRSRPSAGMVLALAERLEIPLRERNGLLLAAGYAPRYRARPLDDPELAPVRDALGQVLAGHEPYPALAVDHHWNLVASNAALGPLLEGVADHLLTPPANALRIALHPEGLAPRIVNLAEWRGHLMHRLERAIALTGDEVLRELEAELRSYPGPPAPPLAGPGAGVMVQLALRRGPGEVSDDGELRFFSTITTFGTAFDITVAELAVEAFFPADPATAEALRAAELTATG
jgi:transcriptional regulator with XRE-family HTH domain